MEKQSNLKIVFITSIFILTSFFSFLPLVGSYYSSKKQFQEEREEVGSLERKSIRRKKRFRKNFLSLTNCFASGVFIGVCLLDLLPEVEEKFDDFIKSNPDFSCNKFPLAQFMVVVGFLILLSFEQIAKECKQGMKNPFHDHQHGYDSIISSTASTIPSMRLEDEEGTHHPHYHHHHRRISIEEHQHSDLQMSKSPFLSRSLEQIRASISNSSFHINYSHEIHRPNEDRSLLVPGRESNLREIENLREELEEEVLEKTEVPTDPSHHSQIRYVMLAFALSIHSIFEGLALGLEDNTSSTVQLFTAIIIHKSVVAFSLGLNMVQSGLKLSLEVIILFIFTLASPIGAVLGLCLNLTDLTSASGLIGSLQALACGSFIFVVFFELLPHEFFTYRKKPSPLLKVFSLSFGIILISVLMLINPV